VLGGTFADHQGRPFRVTEVLWGEGEGYAPKLHLVGTVTARHEYGQATWLTIDPATDEIPLEYVAPEHADWTVAYRKPRANRFHRIPLQLTWKQAMVLASLVYNALDGYEVYTVTTVEADATDRVCAEDKGNVLSVSTGRRVRLVDNGKLPEGVQVPQRDDERVVHYFD
jgi:hypothetical protein